MPLSLVTDRTQNDVSRAKTLKSKIINTGYDSLSSSEKLEWTFNVKGCYNFEDLNRVGNAIIVLTDAINFYGYYCRTSPKIDFVDSDIITEDQIIDYIADLNEVKNRFYGVTVLPTTIRKITVDQANNIEKMLLEVEDNLNRMLASFRYCGELICGEDQ